MWYLFFSGKNNLISVLCEIVYEKHLMSLVSWNSISPLLLVKKELDENTSYGFKKKEAIPSLPPHTQKTTKLGKKI